MEDKEAQRQCLEQYRLTKRQLIWIKQHEAKMLLMERSEIQRLELGGQASTEAIAKARHLFDERQRAIEQDISYANMEISVLDKTIEELHDTTTA